MISDGPSEDALNIIDQRFLQEASKRECEGRGAGRLSTRAPREKLGCVCESRTP